MTEDDINEYKITVTEWEKNICTQGSNRKMNNLQINTNGQYTPEELQKITRNKESANYI